MDDTVRCDYHPRRAARWQCPDCVRTYCRECAHCSDQPLSANPGDGPPCPLCGRLTESVGHANTIVPFWLRIHDFFRYPSHPRALVYMAVLALISTLAPRLGLPGVLLVLMVSVVFVRYAYATLEHTARGHIEPPVVDMDMVTDRLGVAFQQVAVFVLLMIAAIAAMVFLGPLGFVLAFFFLMAIPATVMLLGMEGRIMVAVNPLRHVGLIAGVGWPYLLLCLFLVLLYGGSAIITQLSMHVLPMGGVMFVANFTSMYFTLIMFTLMGYVVYQYHEVLGFDVEAEHEAGEEDEGAAPDPAITRSHILVCEGRVKAALDGLSARLRDGPPDPALRERFHRLLILAGEGERLAGFSRSYIRRMVEEDKTGKALAIYRDTLRLVPDFDLEDARLAVPLIQAAARERAWDMVLALARGFRERYPGNKHIPEVYFLAARALSEGRGQDGKARSIIRQLLEKYPAHARVEEMRRYQQALEKLGAGPA